MPWRRLTLLVLVLATGLVLWCELGLRAPEDAPVPMDPLVRSSAIDEGASADDPIIARAREPLPGHAAEASNARLTGRAFDDLTKAPLHAVRLRILPASLHALELWEPHATIALAAESAADGTFVVSLQTAPETSCWLRGEHPDALPALRWLDHEHFVATPAGFAGSGFDFALVPRTAAARVRGRAVDGHGRGLAASVRLVAGISDRPERGRPRAHAARGDAVGRFELELLAPGRAYLTLEADGFATLARDLELAAASSIDLGLLVLEPAAVEATLATATLTGSVVDENGLPVDAVEVLVRGGGHAPPIRGHTNATGGYRVTGIAAGQATVAVRAAQRPPLTFRHVFRPAEALVFDVRLPAVRHFVGGIVVDGIVVDGERPLSGIEVATTVPYRRTPSSAANAPSVHAAWSFETKTGDDGRFRLDGLPSGPVDLILSSEQGAYRDLVVEAVPVDRDDHRLRFPMPRAVRIHGVVRAGDGAPVAGALLAPAAGVREGSASRTVSGADGSYALEVHLTNHQATRIRVTRTGHVAVTRAFRLVDTSADFAIRWDVELWREAELASVRGVVRDARGAPLAGVECSARAWGLGEQNVRAISDEQGHYALPRLQPGTVRLRFLRDGYRHVEVEEQLVRQAARTRDVALLDLQVATVELGFVIGEAPAADLEVVVTPLAQRRPGQLHLRTAVDGKLLLERWPLDRTIVWVRGGPGIPSQSRHVDLAARPSPLRIQVRAGRGEIRGQVVSPAGVPVPGELVACHDIGGDRGYLEIWIEETTDQNGQFRFHSLPDGSYALDIAGDERHRQVVETGSAPLRIVFPR